MSKTFVSCFGLLILLAPPLLCAQNPDGSQTSGSQPGTSADCPSDPTLASDSCIQNQSQIPVQNPAQGQMQTQGQGPDGYTLRQNQRTGSAAGEDTTLNGQQNNQRLTGVQPTPLDPPTEFQKFVAATTGQYLPLYGANLFQKVPSTFAPINLAPVTSNYVIGPEDELRVRIWGQTNYSGNLRVDRSGDIYLPLVGAVHVAGLPFSELDQHLRSAVAKIYRNFDLSVDIGQIRSIQVYVTGHARRAGVYTVSSLSTLVDALFASGGPSPQGSLRHILLKRDGKTIADFDLYALLIHGDKSHDVRLLPEDVIYIAPAGPEAAVTGSIANPGIYELRDGETLGELIETAGNMTALSSNARVSLERAGPGGLREAMELPVDSKGLEFNVADTDVLRIFPNVPAYQKTVTLRGDVANPGRFNWHAGMHISDLIPDRDSLESRDYWWKRSHLGLPSLEFEPLISNIQRDPYQPESNRMGFTAAVTQETLTSALTSQGRPQQPTEPSSTVPVGSNNATENPRNVNETLGSTTDIGSNAPGTGTSGSLGSQILRPAGPENAAKPARTEVRLASPDIDWDYAVIERRDPDTLKTSLISFDLGKLVINHDSSQDLLLQPSDTITIFSQADIHVPLESQTKYVDLEGEIVHAGIYSVHPGETLRDVIQRAGGFTAGAYLYGSEFDRESTRILQQQRLDEYVRNLTVESERGTQALAISGSGSNTQDVNSSRLIGQNLVARLSMIRATGRIVFSLRPNVSTINDLPPISLENGDRFIVPPVPATVNVVGAVYDQNSFLYRPGRTVGYYLKLAGGSTRDADARRSFIIRADGAVIGRPTIKSLGAWGNSFDDLRLNAGDSLVVPEKTLRPTTLQKFIDATSIFSQLALGVAAIHSF